MKKLVLVLLLPLLLSVAVSGEDEDIPSLSVRVEGVAYTMTMDNILEWYHFTEIILLNMDTQDVKNMTAYLPFEKSWELFEQTFDKLEAVYHELDENTMVKPILKLTLFHWLTLSVMDAKYLKYSAAIRNIENRKSY